MKKNIFSILTLLILFTVSFISSAASSVKLISSGDENAEMKIMFLKQQEH